MTDQTTSLSAAATQLCQSQALRIADIHPSPTNPRKTFPEAEQAELVDSVKRHGVMSPILVRPWPAKYHTNDGTLPKYELIAGERRYRAARAAGLEYISGTVRDLDDHETLELQIVENLHRKDLNELEEAEGYELMTKQYGYSAEVLAEKIDKSKAYIYARLKLTAAGEAAREAFREGKLDASRLLLVARIPTAGLQQKAVSDITSRDYLATYRAAAQYVQSHYMLKLAEAAFPRADANLVPAAGKCHPCPKRTGSRPELYPDVKSADICTDPACYADKKAAHFARLKTEAKAQGRTVIEGAAAKKLMPYDTADIKGYLKLDDKCYDAGLDEKQEGYRTYRELLADKPLPITLVEKQDGGVVEAIEASAFKAIAAEIGVQPKRDSGADERKEIEAAAKQETEVRRRIHAQIRTTFADELLNPTLAPDNMTLVARQFFAQTWHENQKRLARLWIETDEKIGDSERIGRLSTLIDEMSAHQLCLLLIDLALIGTTHCGPWDNTETPAPLLATAGRLDVSVDTIRREVKAEQSAKGKCGKKAAKTEAPVEPAEPEQPAPTEAQLETAPSTAAEFKVGDRVVIQQGADPDLQPDQLGKTGEVTEMITSIVNGKLVYAVKFDDDSDEIAAYADELALQPPAGGEQTATADTPWPTTTELKAGDRVRVKSDKLRKWRRTSAGKEGIVHRIDLDESDAHVSIDGDDRLETFMFDELELIAAVPAAEEPETPAPVRQGASKSEVFYQHPHEPTLAWTGRGRKPKWVEAWLDAGGTLDQLQVRPRCDKTLELPGVASPESESQHQEAA